MYGERSALYELLSQPLQALADYEKLLAISPGRSDIRRRGMILAGKVGQVQVLARMAVALGNITPAEDRSRQLLLLADSFALARDSGRAAKYYQLLMVARGEEKMVGPGGLGGESSLALAHQARLGLADLYRRDGRFFEAEQLLRQGLLAEAGEGDLLPRLFELALAATPPDQESAAVWLEQYARQPLAHPGRLVIMQARLLAASGEYPKAEGLLRSLLVELATAGNQAAELDVQVLHQTGLALVEILVAAGDAAAAEQQCLAMLQGEPDREILVLLAKIYQDVGEAQAVDKIIQRLLEPEEDGIKLLELAELFQQRGLPRGEFAVADRVWGRWPESYRAGILRVESLRQLGEISEALAASALLGERFPEIPEITILDAQINYQGGFYRQAARQGERVLESQPDRWDIQLLRVRSEMALGNLPEATRLIHELYPVEGARYLKKLLGDAALPVPASCHKRSVWQILTFRSEPFFDLVGEVLSARAFCDTIPERSRVNALISPEFAKLRWEKSFRAALLVADDFAPGEGKLAKKK